MTVYQKTINFTGNGTTSTQSITGFGFTPQAFIIHSVNVATAGTHDGDGGIGIGMCDGTTQAAISTAGSDGESHSSVTKRAHANDRVIYLVDQSGAILGEASFTSFASDTITITWASPSTSLFSVTAFSGFDNVKLRQNTTPATATSQSVTGYGFAFDSLITMGVTSSSAPDMNEAPAVMSFGMCDGSLNQGCAAVSSADSAQNSTKSVLYSGSAFCSIKGDVSGIDQRFTISSVDADGFSGTWNSLSTASTIWWGLALKGGSSNVHVLTQPTSTGAQSVTGKTFTPVGLIATTVSSVASTSIASNAAMVIGTATGTSNRAVSALFQANAVTSDITESYSTSLVITHVNGTTTPIASADLTSFNSDGYTLNWGVADATARSHLVLIVGNAAAAPTGSKKNLLFLGVG